jgi:hypothetical protein
MCNYISKYWGNRSKTETFGVLIKFIDRLTKLEKSNTKNTNVTNFTLIPMNGVRVWLLELLESLSD